MSKRAVDEMAITSFELDFSVSDLPIFVFSIRKPLFDLTVYSISL
jgi:hypothetical protein